MALLSIPIKTCGICSKTFAKKSTCSKKEWAKRQGCSPSCAAKLRGAPWLEKYKLRPGATLGKATQFKQGQTEAESNFQWKGDKASYAAKHMWIRYHFGKATECESCGKNDKRMYHWSNISGDYLRERDDWQQLCVPCHKQFDLSRV